MTLTQHQKEWIYRRSLLIAALASVFVILPGTVWAATNYGDVSGAHTSFSAFLRNISTYLSFITGPYSKAGTFIQAEFLAFFIFRFAIVVGQWAVNHADEVDVFAVVMLGAVVQMMMDFYDYFTSLLLSLSGDLGSTIQFPIVGSDDVFFAVSYINAIIDAITLPETTIFDDLKMVILLGFSQLTIWGLSVIAFFCMSWGVWGYALAKLIGWFFVPFLLVERLTPLFDGWLRFFIGFLFYTVIARVNIVLVLILLSSYFGVRLSLGPPASVQNAIAINGDNFSELAGLLSISIVAFFALLSTGKFAVAIAGGVGGFGGVAGRLAQTAALGARRYLGK